MAAVAGGAKSESAAEDLGAPSTFFKSTCVPPGPFQNVSGPRLQRGELEAWPRPWPLLSQVPAFPLNAIQPFFELTFLARDQRTLFRRRQVWKLSENTRRGPCAIYNSIASAWSRATLGARTVRECGSRAAVRGGGRRREEAAETQRQGADLLPGARPLVHSGSGSVG